MPGTKKSKPKIKQMPADLQATMEKIMKELGMTSTRVKPMNMGGVVPGRGGSFKGTK